MRYKLLISSQHRQQLFAKLLPNSIVILPGNDIRYRSNDVEYRFRQDSNFHYLTNFPEPKAIAVFIVGGNPARDHRFILFTQSQDPRTKIWDGDRIGQQGAIELFEADEAYVVDDFAVMLPELLLNKQAIYYPVDINNVHNIYRASKWQLDIIDTLNKSLLPDLQVIDLLPIIAELRVIKSSQELRYIKKAAIVSAEAHNHVMQYIAIHNSSNNLSKLPLTERQVQAEFYNYCLQHGCDDMAYNPIVAGGNNGCILHYTANNSQLQMGDLLLIDAGAEYQYYAADISRTFPISGKFSARQQDLYQLVLLAQQSAIAMIKPGIKWKELQQVVINTLVTGMVDLGILVGSIDGLIEAGAYRDFYMHGSGHFLGLDVHDSGKYLIDGESRELVSGMVFTVEPGLYFAADANVAPEWRGIGIRIEDNIVVTTDGYEVLTNAAVKQIAEIEQLMKI